MKSNKNQFLNPLEASAESKSGNHMLGHSEQPTNSSKNVFVKNCFFKNESNVLSPHVFGKKIGGVKVEDKISAPIMLLESMLALVTKFYYKSDYAIDEFLESVFSSFDSHKDFLENNKKNSALGRKSKRIRKTKHELLKNSNGDSKSEDKNQVNLHESNHLLDYLVSPLKSDICIGDLIRKLDFKRTGDLRMRNVSLWEEI